MAILAPAPFPAGSAERMVAIAATIASDLDRRRREEEASELLARERQARAAAEATSARKDEFLARVGYELRHPLTTIRDVLAAGADEEHRVRVLEVARRRVEQVAELVEDLPDVAAITQGTIELHRERVSVAEVIERGLERARLPHDDGDPVLSVSLPPERLELDADPVRLEQMVATLLESVARDSEPGSRIEILVEREAGEAVLRVRNPEMTPGPRPDLGLGPIVVRKLVELHGGRVEWLGDGRSVDAEVIVRLPALARTEVRMERAIGRARVLLVDDNLDAATSLATLLGLLGHEVEVVHDGPAALAAARTNAPDVALVDIGLPGMDGYAVARRMRERSGKKVMLVALTGYGSEEDRERALAAGFDHHLVKPVDLDTLEGLVAELGAGTSARSKPSSLH
jgi:CheY-like chemotaxis protein